MRDLKKCEIRLRNMYAFLAGALLVIALEYLALEYIAAFRNVKYQINRKSHPEIKVEINKCIDIFSEVWTHL